jgi:hypothetical protein
VETVLVGLISLVSSSPLVASRLSMIIAVLASLTLLLAVVGFSSTLRFHKAHEELRQRIAGSRRGMSARSRGNLPITQGWFF